MVLDARQIVDGHLGVAQHPPVGRDHGDPRRGRPRAPQRERVKLGRRGVPRDQRAGLVVQEPPDADQAGLERVHRERLEGAGQVETGHDDRDGDEADEGQRELARDAAPEEVDERLGHGGSVSSRYPTDFTVPIRLPASPSFARRRRTCTSTVRDSIASARA